MKSMEIKLSLSAQCRRRCCLLLRVYTTYVGGATKVENHIKLTLHCNIQQDIKGVVV